MDHDGRRLMMPEGTMRQFGYRVVDMVVDHLVNSSADPVVPRLSPVELARVLGEDVPSLAGDPVEVSDGIHELLPAGNAHPDHPRFLAFAPSPRNYVSVLAAMLAAGFAVPTGWRFSGPVSSAIELTVIRWLVELLDLPAGMGGLFVSGGSTANLTALTVARDTLVGSDIGTAVAYCSDQTHHSVPRALHVLGIRADHVRILSTKDNGCTDPAEFAARITEDRLAGLTPFTVVANAGTTSTGAVDPLPELAALCARQRLWLHADGAYGAAARITEPGRHALAGLADDELIGRTRRYVADYYRVRPAFRGVHSMTAESPEECEHLMTTEFRNTILGLFSYRIPTHADWLLDQDLTGAHQKHREQLERIVARRPGGHLVLKCPSHIWHLPALTAVYPNASLVIVRRDPVQTVASVCGLAAHARATRSDQVDPREIGAQLTRVSALARQRLADFRAARPAGVTMIDIDYAELCARPVKSFDFSDCPTPLRAAGMTAHGHSRLSAPLTTHKVAVTASIASDANSRSD